MWAASTGWDNPSINILSISLLGMRVEQKLHSNRLCHDFRSPSWQANHQTLHLKGDLAHFESVAIGGTVHLQKVFPTPIIFYLWNRLVMAISETLQPLWPFPIRWLCFLSNAIQASRRFKSGFFFRSFWRLLTNATNSVSSISPLSSISAFSISVSSFWRVGKYLRMARIINLQIFHRSSGCF